jgi:hypothetical protein
MFACSLGLDEQRSSSLWPTAFSQQRLEWTQVLERSTSKRIQIVEEGYGPTHVHSMSHSFPQGPAGEVAEEVGTNSEIDRVSSAAGSLG